MAYNGTGALPGAITNVSPTDSAATIQSKLNSVQAGNTLVFASGTYDFAGATIIGKSGVTLWADGPVAIKNAPGAGTSGAFNFSGKSDWTIGGKAPGQGFVFQGSLIDATNASGWAVGNSQFINEASNGYDGSAIRMNGASSATIINNDFTGAGGNVLGMYNLNHITIDGNHFTNCFEPIAIQEPTTNNASLGNNIVIQRNTFVGTQRVAIEIGPAPSGTEHFSGLVITNNYFDNFNNTAGKGTLLAISVVGQSSDNTTITNNFIRRGPADAGDVGVAIEMTGTGEVSGNTIVNFSYAALTYQSGWNVHGNTVYNDGSSPYYGFANNGRGTGTFGAETVLAGAPPAPAMPGRAAWGSGTGTAAAPLPAVTEALASDTGVSSTDRITSKAALNGTADPNATIHFIIDGSPSTATATANASGVWSFATAGLTDGQHTVVATETNAAGQVGSSSLSFQLDSKAPAVTAAFKAANGTAAAQVTGTGDPGATVNLTVDGKAAGTVSANAQGVWSYAVGALTAGEHTIVASQADAAGNVGSATAAFTLGSVQSPAPPSAPPATDGKPAGTGVTGMSLANDTGISTDKISNSAVLKGTADANAVIHFTIDGSASTATATAGSTGTWSFAPSGLSDGSHSIVASETAGGATASLTFALDTKGPNAVLKSAVLSDGQVTLTGTTDGAGDTFYLYEGYSLLGTAKTADDGHFSVVAAAPAGVPHVYGGVAVDAAGNWGPSSNRVTGAATSDSSTSTAGSSPHATEPGNSDASGTMPKLTIGLASDTGASTSDLITSDPALKGTADAGATVHFVIDGNAAAATATANGAGAWSFTPGGLADGQHIIEALQTGASGQSGASFLTFTLDAGFHMARFTGVTAANGQAALAGTTGEVGDTVHIYDGNSWLGAVRTAGDGTWHFTASADGAATHTYGVLSLDAAGHVRAGLNKLILGSSAADTLTGSASGEVIGGNGGNDAIAGGGGADTLTGGAGRVSFAYKAVADSTPAAADTITDFRAGTDKLDFTQIAGINAANGTPLFQGNITGSGNLTLNAHSVAYLEVGNTTEILVNASDAAKTVTTADVHAADVKIDLLGIHLGLGASDFHHA